jgi:hypothetical protein
MASLDRRLADLEAVVAPPESAGVRPDRKAE